MKRKELHVQMSLPHAELDERDYPVVDPTDAAIEGLEQIVRKIQDGLTEGNVHDVNGTTVGKWAIR